jgi:hypothetical protein
MNHTQNQAVSGNDKYWSDLLRPVAIKADSSILYTTKSSFERREYQLHIIRVSNEQLVPGDKTEFAVSGADWLQIVAESKASQDAAQDRIGESHLVSLRSIAERRIVADTIHQRWGTETARRGSPYSWRLGIVPPRSESTYDPPATWTQTLSFSSPVNTNVSCVGPMSSKQSEPSSRRAPVVK